MAEDNKRAYNALLTLLNDDSQPLKKIRRFEAEMKPSQAKDLASVEGMDEIDELNSAADQIEDNEEEDEEIQVEDDNEGDKLDPFEVHFANPPSFDPPTQWESKVIKSLPLLGDRTLLQVPNNLPQEFAVRMEPTKSSTALKKLKYRLQAPFERTNGDLTPLQLELATPLFNYQDIFLTNQKTESQTEIHNLIVLHMINHVTKTRDRVLKNNQKLKEHEKFVRENRDKDIDEELDLRDQGFTRPKVLVLLPTRNAAYEFVETLNRVSGLAQSENRKRFKEAFYQKSADLSSKPEDFQRTFAGNTNEVFCLGVKLTRQALKLYASFYASDIIVASPLGLRLIVDKKDFDFLSSIEMVICDQLDVSAQQSWTNVKHVFEKLNLIPKNPHDCDFSRVKEFYLNERAKNLRQTILMSGFATPEMVALFNKHCVNEAGKIRTRSEIPGVLKDLRIHIRQIYTRVSVSSFVQDAQQRLNHFTSTLLPSMMRGAQNEGIFIVAPTYTDFVMLRNYLEKNDYSYVSLSEYTSPSQLGRGRTFFANGKAKIMLYSARLHHYRRYSIKGIHNVVFYGLPDNPLFYAEFIRMLARTVLEQHVDPDLLKVQVLFSKWDALKLERIVGSERMATFIEGPNDTHEFV